MVNKFNLAHIRATLMCLIVGGTVLSWGGMLWGQILGKSPSNSFNY